MTLEREIYSIETANINKETLDAMRNASAAMKQIHGGLTIDKVDQTMEELREQHAIGEEIGEAITQSIGTNALDEDELDEELAELQQEELDNKMLNTGSVPVGDQITKLPSAPEGGTHITSILFLSFPTYLPTMNQLKLTLSTQSKAKHPSGKRKRMKRRNYGNCKPKWQCNPNLLSLSLVS